jgi:hypothetical protein
MTISRETKDVSRKLYREDIILLKEMETELWRNGEMINQKELIDKSVKFAAKQKEEFFKFAVGKQEKDNTEELVERFLRTPKKDLGGNFLEEIDTTM